MTERTVHWQGVDDPERFDEATIQLGTDALSAAGTSTTPNYRLRWSLQTGAGWVTRSLLVDVTAPTWSRSLRLDRNTDGSWTSTGTAKGVPVTTDGRPLVIEGSDWAAADGTSPGIVDPASLLGADDCDLGLCPVTNTMPMLRSVLPTAPDVAAGRDAVTGPNGAGPDAVTGPNGAGPDGASEPAPGSEIDFVMAWVEVPSLRVIRSEQIYQLRQLDRVGGAVVRYIGLHRSFEGDLTVDADGVVIDYPELARRIDPVAQ